MRQHVYQVCNTYIKFRFTCGELDLLQNIVDWSEYSKFSSDVHFLCFRPEKTFVGKFGPKNQNCQDKLTSGTYINWNMQNSRGFFTLSLFLKKYPFLGKLGPKIRNFLFKVNKNLIHRLIAICRVQWWCSFYIFSIRKMLFGQIWYCHFKLKFSS